MRRAYLFPLVCILLSFPAPSYGQAWSGIIAPNRAIDWSHAGLPASYPDGETTANGWTPPSGRTQCGSTLTPIGGGSDDTAHINNALSSCTNGHYVLLGPGTFSIKSQLSIINSYRTLRGSGPMSTILQASGSGWVDIGQGWGGGFGTASSGLSAGSTSITINSSSAPSANNMGWLTQCDTGTSGNPCSGTPSDNGGLFVCGENNVCQGGDTATPPPPTHEKQVFWITNVVNNGGNSYTLTVSPGIYNQTWSTKNTAIFTWYDPSLLVAGVGIEDMSIVKEPGDAQNNVLYLSQTYGSWVKGVRIIGPGVILSVQNNKNSLVANNYVFGFYPTNPPNQDNVVVQLGTGSDDLLMNNIVQTGVFLEGSGRNQGEVIAYNYARDSKVNGVWVSEYQHSGTPFFILHEGEQVPQAEDDDTWGTDLQTTYFRNYYRCTDSPFISENPTSAFGIIVSNYSRFTNIIGNVLGTSGACTVYSGSPAEIYYFGSGDALALTTTMRWGNFDAVTDAVRWCGNSNSPGWSATCGGRSEVPTALTGNAAPLENAVPGSTTLPPTFFLGISSAHPNGGTGLSWWKVCKTWATFPTSCATSQTQPFPPIGPDVSGGPYDSGYAYDNPAGVAWQYLPIDTTYQNSYSVTGSSWSDGTETLTVSGLPNTNHLDGGFQLIGANSGCNPSGSELLMTNSSTTTISYALASNPGVSCTGTMRWPDVRQFDERVYQTDTGGGGNPNPPTGLNGFVN